LIAAKKTQKTQKQLPLKIMQIKIDARMQLLLNAISNA
jgi:hypothetical protein